mgnify:CR=1 FL=1
MASLSIEEGSNSGMVAPTFSSAGSAFGAAAASAGPAFGGRGSIETGSPTVATVPEKVRSPSHLEFLHGCKIEMITNVH